MHCNKFQTITTPDGMTMSLCGQYVGRRNDRETLNESELSERLSAHYDLISPEKKFAIYGDEGYSGSRYIVVPHSKSFTSPLEEETNHSLSKARVAIEMEFGKVVQYLSGPKCKYLNKLKQTAPARKYVLATVFKNMHTCV